MIKRIYKTVNGKIVVERKPVNYIDEKNQNKNNDKPKNKKSYIIALSNKTSPQNKEKIIELVKEQGIKIIKTKNKQADTKYSLKKTNTAATETKNDIKKHKKSKHKPKTFHNNNENEF
jgi:hypothetical protein